MIEILEQSIANGWQGIFELKNKPSTFIDKAISITEQANQVFNEWDNKYGNSKTIGHNQ